MAATAAFRRSQVESSKSAGRTGAAGGVENGFEREKERRSGSHASEEECRSKEGDEKTFFFYVAVAL